MDQPLAAGSPAEGSQLRAAPRSRPASPVNQLGWHQFDFQRQLGRGSSGTAELVLRKSDGMLLVMKVIQVVTLFRPTMPAAECTSIHLHGAGAGQR